ncbi:1-acylglycerol-3-phosphate O-acyltransferase [Ectopseudomonas mendocina]|uniref:1-acyl-sn-glycerol-3-phosphate acyltransferase n=1 Tax=Ectopseudomonas mendocina TaxID=300 RepID=A0ABZ2RBQ3_ECTME
MLFILRMLAMGVHFILASLIGLLVCLCRPFNPDNSRICGRLYSVPGLWILRWKLKAEIRSLTEQHGACVFVANHQSNFDLYVFSRIVPPRTVSVGKKSLKWVPFFGQIYWLAGNILIDRDNAIRARHSLVATTDALKNRDTSIWVFPEGTRNHGKGLQTFKKGAFQMAVAAGVPIIPVCVSTYPKHVKFNSWNGGTLHIRSLPPIPTAGLDKKDLPQLMENCRTQMQQCIAELDQQVSQKR